MYPYACTFLCFLTVVLANMKYEPNWDSLDSRPIPSWYDECKIGIFVHWGVYSVPSIKSEWFWNFWKENDTSIVKFMNEYYPKKFTYQEFAYDFTAELFDPLEWVKLFQMSGARYVVLTGKHHDGYTLWPSNYSFSWNSVETGPHRDLVEELAMAVRTHTNLRFGVYYSLREWYHPLYMSEANRNFTGDEFYYKKLEPELKELVTTYFPDIVWTDGTVEANDTYWHSVEFLTWLYNESPVKESVVVNDRWGQNTVCKHGGVFTCRDWYQPGVLQNFKWESAMSIDKHSFGFRRNANLSQYLTSKELIAFVVKTVSCGGNVLINVGPTKDGIITPIFQERLLDLGEWLSVNGEAIYGSTSWIVQNDTSTNSEVWYTLKENTVYGIILKWPEDNLLELKSINRYFKNGNLNINLLESNQTLQWTSIVGSVYVVLPDKAKIKGQHAWVIRILFY